MNNGKYYELSKKEKINLALLRAYKPAPKSSAEIPIGLLYIISALRNKFPGRFNYKIIDMPLHTMSVNSAYKALTDFKSDIVGISAFTYENQIVRSLVEKIKDNQPGIPVIIGGPYASASTGLALKENPRADYIFIGEAEIRLPLLMDAIISNKSVKDIYGIAYWENESPVIHKPAEYIQDLDSLPNPAWDMLDIDSYNKSPLRPTNHFRKQKRVVPVFSTRGCPYRCAYCHKIFGKSLRIRSADNFFSELMDLYENYGVREIHVLDDAFNLAKERMREICNLIIKNRLRLSIGFASGLRGDQLTFEDVDLLKKAGAYFIRYAVETASPRLQEKIHKYVNLPKLSDIIEYTAKKGIFTQGLFMIGFPTETLDEINTTVNFALKSSFHSISAFQVVPFPGTDLYDMAKEIYPDYEYNDSYLFFSGKSFYQEYTGIDLNPIQKRMYQKFYYNPLRIYRIIKDLPEKSSLISSAGSILNNTILRNIWVKKN